MKRIHLQLTALLLTISIISKAQNVGINTTSPAFDLHVEGDQYISNSLYFDTYKLTEFFKTGGNLNIATEANLYLKPRAGYSISIFEGSNEYATFDGNTQALGLGTTSPQEKLHVDGNIKLTDTIFFNLNNNEIYESGSNLNMKSGANIKLRPGDDQYDVSIFSSSTEYATFEGLTESLGLGTTSPQKKLDVQGSINLSDSLFFNDEYNLLYKDGANLNVKAGANLKLRSYGDSYDVKILKGNTEFATFEGSTESLGLGTTNPQKKLDVQGSAILSDTLFFDGSQGQIYKDGDNLNVRAGANLKLRGDAGGYDVIIYTDNTKIATFDGDTQNVGIGTSSPAEKLDVVGVVKAEQLQMTNGASAGHTLVSDASGLASWAPIPSDTDWTVIGPDMVSGTPGNVNIGTGLPTSKLTVNGSFAINIITFPGPVYTLLASDHTAIFTAPTAQVSLPPANTCPGREYVLKYTNLGGTLNVGMPGDLIEGTSALFTVPAPSTTGLNGTTFTVKSDGVSTWWITSMGI